MHTATNSETYRENVNKPLIKKESRLRNSFHRCLPSLAKAKIMIVFIDKKLRI